MLHGHDLPWPWSVNVVQAWPCPVMAGQVWPWSVIAMQVWPCPRDLSRSPVSVLRPCAILCYRTSYEFSLIWSTMYRTIKPDMADFLNLKYIAWLGGVLNLIKLTSSFVDFGEVTVNDETTANCSSKFWSKIKSDLN